MKYPLLHKAVDFATYHHSTQDRKYSGLPYITHPLRVMSKVREVTDDEAMLCAAVLHDTVEDTRATYEIIGRNFGQEVQQLVFWLTDTAGLEDGNRHTRKEIELHRLREAPRSAQTIKLADLIDNTASITKADPNFAKVYMREKEALLRVLTGGIQQLQAEAWHQMDLYKKSRNPEHLIRRKFL